MTARHSEPRPVAFRSVSRAVEAPEANPLGSLLATELEEERVPEIWRRLDGRLAAREPRVRRWVPWTAAAACAALALLLVVRALAPRGAGPSPLALSTGDVPATVTAGAAGRALAFADGSRLELSPATRFDVLRNDGRAFVTALRRGHTLFDVRPGGPRRWVVEAGLASVEVVGTRFSVSREGAAVAVEVERGIVVVRSELLPNGAVRLLAGQHVSLRAPAPPALSATAEARSSAAGPGAAGTGRSAAAVAPSSLSPSALLPAPPSPEGVTAAPRASSAAPVPAPGTAVPDAVDASLQAADRARRRGDFGAAVRELDAALGAAAPGDKRRGLAALSLARLVLDSDPARAASVLRDAFGAVPTALVEDALARRVEAEGRAGHLDEAARLAGEYRRRFPNGQRSAEVDRWARR